MTLKTHSLPVHPVTVASLPDSGKHVKVEARPQDYTAIAEFLDVDCVRRLTADLRLARWKKDGVRVTGTLVAELNQVCVVTLDPLETNLQEEVEALFVPEGSRLARPEFDADGEMVLSADGPDLPETYTGNSLDMWSIILEHLALAIDPFPRKPGAVANHEAVIDEAEYHERAEKSSPFAVLESLKSKNNSKNEV